MAESRRRYVNMLATTTSPTANLSKRKRISECVRAMVSMPNAHAYKRPNAALWIGRWKKADNKFSDTNASHPSAHHCRLRNGFAHTHAQNAIFTHFKLWRFVQHARDRLHTFIKSYCLALLCGGVTARTRTHRQHQAAPMWHRSN